MTPDERELRRALDARSGELSPEFRRRLSGALNEGRPPANLMPGVALAIVVVLTLASVGTLLLARGAGRVSYGGPVSGTHYTVTTTLMTDRRGRIVACHINPLPMPPILCGGVTVTNVDLGSIPGTQTYSNGVVETPRVRMVGTWDGHVLRLIEQPQVTTAPGTQPQPVTQAPPASATRPGHDVFAELTRDDSSLRERGIVLLEWGQGSEYVLPYVILAVADARSVQYLYETYGPMKISGWLQPVNPPTQSPTPTPHPPIALPTTVYLSVPSGQVLWAYFQEGFLFRSNDRGETWEQRTLPVAQPGQWPAISFVDAQQGWFSESGSPETQCSADGIAIWHTADGAATWQLVATAGIAEAQCKEGLSFVDPARGFLGAWDGNHQPTIYRTTDGGRTWVGSNLPDPPGFRTQAGGFTLRAGLVHAFGTTLLVQAFDQNQPGSYVFRSSDGGAAWSPIARVDGTADLGFVTASRWLRLTGPDQSVETTDAGQTWHLYPSDYSQAAPIAPQFAFGDPQTGYATVRGEIRRTADGGLHWVVIKTPGT
jgi:photosystem II stability/assembly factor-like uncharacterized protein